MRGFNNQNRESSLVVRIQGWGNVIVLELIAALMPRYVKHVESLLWRLMSWALLRWFAVVVN